MGYHIEKETCLLPSISPFDYKHTLHLTFDHETVNSSKNNIPVTLIDSTCEIAIVTATL